MSDDGAIISEKTAKLLNAEVGDTISIKDENEGNKEIIIQNICENYMGHYLYMTPASIMKRCMGKSRNIIQCCFLCRIVIHESRWRKQEKRFFARDEVLSLSYMKDIEKRLNDMLKSLNLVIIVLIVSPEMWHLWCFTI